MLLLILGLLAAVSATPATEKETYKDQYSGSAHSGKHKGKHTDYSSEYCTDPRTMRKHAAYTEWADAYSCTRHRCQPGGRNLAIYTVGCKRVEAPESAIECEEVVEDTNMQFPFCCTRLRCLVVVRGEVWTRVLGQPWEVLLAAPWSHMYKMKKPPPPDSSFLPSPKINEPVYELSEPDTEASNHDKVLRSEKKQGSPDSPDCNEIAPRAAPPPPDIVIALSTNNEMNEPVHKKESLRRKRVRKTTPNTPKHYFEDEREKEKHIEPEVAEVEEVPVATEKPQGASEEKVYPITHGVTEMAQHKPRSGHHQVTWTEIPQNQWNEPGGEFENRLSDPNYQQSEYMAQENVEPKIQSIKNLPTNKEEKPNNLQALVDAIGTRMKDIENVVQKMSDKVHQVTPGAESSGEKRMNDDLEGSHRRHNDNKRPGIEAEHYKRFSVNSNRVSKYLHTSDSTTEPPLLIGDTNLTGYFSDASNSVLRRNTLPKELPPIYMAPVESRRKVPGNIAVISDDLNEGDKKKKKHAHKKKKNKSHSHKKHSHSKDDKRKRFNKLSSGETDKNLVSLEDSSILSR